MGRIKTLFAAQGAKFKRVVITEDGQETEIFVGKLTVAQRDRFLAYFKDLETGGSGAAQAYVVQVAVYEDEQGTRAFSDSEDDTKAIMNAPAAFVQKLAEEVLDFNRIEASETALKDAAKNS